MTTNEPRSGSPADDYDGTHGPAAEPTPDSEPQYVTEQFPPGAQLYPTRSPYDYGRPMPGPYGAQDATHPGAQYPQGPHGPYAEPVAYGQPGSYPAGGYSGVSYQGSAYPGHGGGHGGGYGSAVQYPYPYAQQGYGYPGLPGYGAPLPPAAPSRRKRALVGIGAAVVAAGLVLSGVAIAESRQDNGTSTAQLPSNGSLGNGSLGNGSAGSGGTGSGGSGSGSQGILPGGGSVGNGAGNGTSTSASVASKAQQVGIVTIVSVLGYQTAESAGTGMILSSDGTILTNNHVINGATSITVTVESTGKSYRADVVGTAPTKDVAVLKLRNASGLATAKIDDTPDAAVGDAVTGVGNAGGTGTLRAASGKITALEQSITATDESGANAEKLTGLYQIDAGIISGDSGGPLYDADGDVIGMDTAASASNGTSTTQAQAAYAIPIDDALGVADQIKSGKETSVVHIGLPAFIGVQVLPTGTGGATIQALNPTDGPAAKAGVTPGSVITAVGNTKVSDATALKAALGKYEPGQSVTLTWTDASGKTQSGTATLIAGPAD